MPAVCSAMESLGFRYLNVADFPTDWARSVAAAEAAVDEGLERARSRAALESINSERLQLRFKGGLEALPPAVRSVVKTLQQTVAESCGSEYASYVLQDCYALFTPREEEGEEARAPQRWHMDAVKAFPVAALLLRGRRATEFAAGNYSDLSSGVSDAQLEAWTASLKHITAHTWESESAEEWEHFSRHLHAADLVTGVDAESGEPECDWSKLEVVRTPNYSPGCASIFWSNKVHRGPATEPGEERLVLFCTWLPPGAIGRQSETDYSYYDGHLEPKLHLSQRAKRSSKRRRVA